MAFRAPAGAVPSPAPGQLAITWLGHATVLVEMDGLRVLTDPVLRNRIGPLVRIAPPVCPDAVGRVDCVLLSHLHADHTDLPTLRAIARFDPVLAPHPAAEWLRAKGLRDVRDLRVGGQMRVGGLRVVATTATHDGRRRPFGPEAEPIGFVIRGSSSVYFAGDTEAVPPTSELRGALDVALLPVWGWGPALGPGHLDPERAAASLVLISPRVVIPIHWGTFALRWPARPPADPQRPAREFAERAKHTAPAVEVRVLTPGERTVL